LFRLLRKVFVPFKILNLWSLHGWDPSIHSLQLLSSLEVIAISIC